MKPSNSRWKIASAKTATAQDWLRSAGAQSWWNQNRYPGFGDRFESDPNYWIGTTALQKAFEGGPALRLGHWEGNLVVPAANLIEATQRVLGLRLIRISDNGNGNGQFILASEDVYLTLRFNEKGRWVNAQIGTTNEELTGKAAMLFDRCIVPDDPRKGLVFSLIKTMSGYTISRLGMAGTPLERANYPDAVLDPYDHVVEDLRTESPCGRLVILAGAPGTGKTFLVRSLLSEVTKAAWILVPPQLMPELGSPDILPALTSAKNEFDGPIVLIIEDADQCLVQRRQGDMSAISSMLNLGDGILGSILDIRILATTNAKTLEMDEATRRPGRLCRYIEVGTITPEFASGVLQRLTGKSMQFKGPQTLAQVYSQARALGWKPPPKEPEKPALRAEIL